MEKIESKIDELLKPAKIPRLAVSHEFVYRLFYPQIPVILSAKSGNSIAAMPAVSCMSVSNDPPLIGVSVAQNLRTNRVLKKAANFSINWINFRKRKIISSLSEAAKKADKLKEAGIPYTNLLGAPIITDSMAYIICQKTQTIVLGDHSLFVGKVLGSMASTDFDEYWKFSEYRPLLYRGSYFRAPFITIPRSS